MSCNRYTLLFPKVTWMLMKNFIGKYFSMFLQLLVHLWHLILTIFSQFKTKGGSQLKEYCSNLTKEDCRRQSGSFVACDKVSVFTIEYQFSKL